ncbi:MAG TPA: stalk domain-containing protein [Syntrophomonas sp.]|nr:stalk domain-containing protein [Syntrophomonas sp.]
MKWIMRALVVGMLFFMLPPQAQAAAVPAEITLEMDGQTLAPDVAPLIHNDRTLVPFRTVAEALNLQVDWNAETQEVTVVGSGLTLTMQIGAQTATKNGETVFLDVPPMIVSGRTMVPVRFISEACGCRVVWNDEARKVSIYSQLLEMEVMGYYALGDAQTSSWTDLFGTSYPERAPGNTDIVKELIFGWYTMDEQGQLLTQSDSGWQRPEGWEDILDAAASFQLKTQMCIQMTDQNAKIRNMINDSDARQLAIQTITAEADQYDSVNLDFEGLGWNDTPEELSQVRSDFTAFVTELAAALHEQSKELSLSLHPLNSDYPGYDYQALGLQADQIIIMAYDYGTKPEPVDRVEEAVQLAIGSVSPEKLVLGISAVNETEDSIADKITIAGRYNLKGIALWRLGLVTDAEWEILRSEFTYEL